MSDIPDLLAPVLADNPSEWPEFAPYDPDGDRLIDERMAQRDPEAAEIELALRRAGIISTREAARRRQIATTRWFLLKNNVLRERSAVTGRIEAYWTYQGLPLPYCGLDAIVAAVQRVVDPEARLPELVAARFSEIVLRGDIEPISPERARELCGAIFVKTRGRVDLWKGAQERARHGDKPDPRARQRTLVHARRTVRHGR